MDVLYIKKLVHIDHNVTKVKVNVRITALFCSFVFHIVSNPFLIEGCVFSILYSEKRNVCVSGNAPFHIQNLFISLWVFNININRVECPETSLLNHLSRGETVNISLLCSPYLAQCTSNSSWILYQRCSIWILLVQVKKKNTLKGLNWQSMYSHIIHLIASSNLVPVMAEAQF